MNSDNSDTSLSQGPSDERRGWTRLGKGLFVLLVIIVALVALLYWQRIFFADYVVRDQLNRLSVNADFKLEKIGVRQQRLRNLVIGNPARPDLTAALVEIETSFSLSGPVIHAIRARDVFVRGRYENGQFRFGELDKFRDLNSKGPIEIPDYRVDIENGRIAMASPWGPIGIGINGRGILRNAFRSKLAVRAPSLSDGDCTAQNLRFDGDFEFIYREPKLLGPLVAANANCKKSDAALTAPATDLDLKGSADFADWAGQLGFAARTARIAQNTITAPKGKSTIQGSFASAERKWTTETDFALAAWNSAAINAKAAKGRLMLDLDLTGDQARWLGDVSVDGDSIATDQLALNAANARFAFDGSFARTNFEGKIGGKSAAFPPLATGDIRINSRGHVDQKNGRFAVVAQGDVQMDNGRLPKQSAPILTELMTNTKGTPIGPLMARLVPELAQTLTAFDGQLRYDMVVADRGTGKVRIDGARFVAKSGGLLNQLGAVSLAATTPYQWQVQSSLQIALSGGRLPSAQLKIEPGARGLWSGTLALSNYAVPGASLSLSRLNFAGRPGAPWALLGNAFVSGPLPGGRIDGLSLPISGIWSESGGALYDACTNIAFKRVQYGNLILPADSFRVCPDKGRAIVRYANGKLGLAGSVQNFNAKALISNSPIAVDSTILRFDIGSGFTARNVNVVLGKSDQSQSRFNMAAIDGRFVNQGLAGQLSGGNGTIGSVPLLISDTTGKWTYEKGILALEGAMRVADSTAEQRFKPVLVPDFMLELEKGVIAAIGTIREPTTQRAVADVDLRHDLNSTKGRALFSVDNLKFEPSFQPELLTPLVLGVVASVNGNVDGDGIIEWEGANVKSSGRFGTKSMSMAAAFGPIEGLSTDIVFSDLLNFETGTGQLAQLGTVNPGIQAFNGKITYQLLPGKRVGIEGGRWPFAGGELLLEPTILDFDILKPRRLTFRVIGVDAEKFFANYEFENLRVSGVFDGTLPMIFDSEGGKIVDGNLVSRAGGGEVSYLGELSYADKGVFADFAFNALKSMRYQQLVINVGGKIDGEIITKVSFSGIQQGSLAKRNFITRQLGKIPLEFNVSITAQFMQLIGNLRQLYDPDFDQSLVVNDLIEEEKRILREKANPPKSPENDAANPTLPKGE